MNREEISKEISNLPDYEFLTIADWHIEQIEKEYHNGYADGTKRKQIEIREARKWAYSKGLESMAKKMIREVKKAKREGYEQALDDHQILHGDDAERFLDKIGRS